MPTLLLGSTESKPASVGVGDGGGGGGEGREVIGVKLDISGSKVLSWLTEVVPGISIGAGAAPDA